MDEDLKLYIPLGVKPEAELFTGFGKKQLFQSIVGSLVMGGIAALAWFFTENVTTTVILALAGIFGSVMMTTKDQSNLSVVDQVQNLIRFLRGQKIYPYRYGDEWVTEGREMGTGLFSGMNGGLNNVRNHSGLLPLAGGSRPKG